MSTDEVAVAPDVAQVTDFHFHACRKFRLFDRTSSTFPNGHIIRNRLATSSQLGVTFAVVNSKQMMCFSTKSLSSYKLTKENMNLEVTDLAVKSFQLAKVSAINDIGVNSDGTLLAVLHTENNDVFADIFDIRNICTSASSAPFTPICSTRIGMDATNQGTAIEWNPAFPDTFAAAATDRSLLVVKIDPANPSAQKIVGVGKLGGYTTAISWSPKGKQLTIGDALGRIVQLKPELDVIRAQSCPDHVPNYGQVTGICWLATTEWLVSFQLGNDQEAFLMRCKKDKPTEWIQFHELSYSSSKWPLPPQLFTATHLLIDWNVVLVANSMTSEVSPVGKREDWRTWVSEGESIYFPTTADGKDTVAVGVAVDRTMTEEVSLNPEGSQKHRPSPLILCLTNDGVLSAHHIISTFPAHQPCQIPSQNIQIQGLVAPTPQKQSAFSPIVPSAQQLPTTSPSTLFQQKPAAPTPTAPLAAPGAPGSSGALFGAKPPVAAPKGGLFGAPATPSTPEVKAAPVKVEPPKTPVQAAPVPPEDPTTPEIKQKAEQLAAKKKILVEKWTKINSQMASTKDSVMKMRYAATHTKTAVSECSEVIKASLSDSKEVMEELKNLISSIEWMAERTKHTVKEMDFEIEEKMEMVADVADDGERILEKLRDLSENEKMMRFNKLETSADMLSSKFAECNELIKTLRSVLTEKESLRKQAVLSPLRNNSNLNQLKSGAEMDVALKVMRNVSKIVLDTRERIQRTELEFVHFQRQLEKNEAIDANQSIRQVNVNDVSILEKTTTSDAAKIRGMTDDEIVKARQAMIARIQKRGALKTRNVTVESYRKTAAPVKKEDEIDTSNLSSALLKLSMTPRRVMATSSIFNPNAASAVRRDATTQANEPPVVQTVVVTVDSPAKPVQTPPVTTTPLQKPATTTTSAAGTSPLVAPKVPATVTEPVKEEKPTPSTSIFSGGSGAGSSSIFGGGSLPKSGSLFNTTPKSSIFGGKPAEEKKPEEVSKAPEVVKKPEEVKPKEPEPAAPKPVEEPPKTEEPKKEEPQKVVEPKKEPEQPVVEQQETPVKEEPKAEEAPAVPKTPSFSFNTSASSTTPKPATSSIFGGGLSTPVAASTTPSSVFGGGSAAKTTTPPGGSSNIFGGGAKPTTGASPFGSFGQGSSAAPAASGAAGASGAPAAAPVSFSFNTAAAAAPKPSFGAFGASQAPAKTSIFGGGNAAPKVPIVDDGMEDDSMVSGGGPGGFMSGLGGSGSGGTSQNSGANPFAPKPSTGTSNNSWLFGGGNAQNQNQQQQQQQKPSFSFTNPSAAQQQPSATGTTSVFGGAPKFGSQPVFGAKPFGGSPAGGGGLSKNSSIFGGATAAPAGGGFAQFATGQKTSSLFGAAAAAPSQGGSIFGGGAPQTAAPTNSIFGGGAAGSANKPSTFSNWR